MFVLLRCHDGVGVLGGCFLNYAAEHHERSGKWEMGSTKPSTYWVLSHKVNSSPCSLSLLSSYSPALELFSAPLGDLRLIVRIIRDSSINWHEQAVTMGEVYRDTERATQVTILNLPRSAFGRLLVAPDPRA